MVRQNGLLSGSFLQSVLRSSKYVGLILAAAGLAVTRDYRFVLAFAVGSVVDMVSMAFTIERAAAAEGEMAKTVAGITAVRLIVKSLLIAAAAFTGIGAVLWGMVLGVLVVEITLMTVGVLQSVRGVRW